MANSYDDPFKDYSREAFTCRIAQNGVALEREMLGPFQEEQIGDTFDDAYDGGIYLKKCLQERLEGKNPTEDQIKELMEWKSVQIQGEYYRMQQVEEADGEISDDGPRSLYSLIKFGLEVYPPPPPPPPSPTGGEEPTPKPESPKKNKSSQDKIKRARRWIGGLLIPIVVVVPIVLNRCQASELIPDNKIVEPDNPIPSIPEIPPEDSNPPILVPTPEYPDSYPENPESENPNEENPSNVEEDHFSTSTDEVIYVEEESYFILSKIFPPSLITEPSAEKAGQEEMLDIYRYGLGKDNKYDPVKHAEREESALKDSEEFIELTEEYNGIIESLSTSTDSVEDLKRMKEILSRMNEIAMEQQGVFHQAIEDFNKAAPDVSDVGRDRTRDVTENDKRAEEFLIQNMINIKTNISNIDTIIRLIEEGKLVLSTQDYGTAQGITLGSIAKAVQNLSLGGMTPGESFPDLFGDDTTTRDNPYNKALEKLGVDTKSLDLGDDR